MGSDRVVEQCLPALDDIRDIEPETNEQVEKVREAEEAIQWVMEDDRDRNGLGPTDKLVAALDARNGGES